MAKKKSWFGRNWGWFFGLLIVLALGYILLFTDWIIDHNGSAGDFVVDQNYFPPLGNPITTGVSIPPEGYPAPLFSATFPNGRGPMGSLRWVSSGFLGAVGHWDGPPPSYPGMPPLTMEQIFPDGGWPTGPLHWIPGVMGSQGRWEGAPPWNA